MKALKLLSFLWNGIALFTVFFICCKPSLCGQNIDTLPVVEISSPEIKNQVMRLEPIQATYLYNGKKNEVISIQNSMSSLSDKIGRQIFAKVPGVFIYDMDGAGNQMNISARGLDPHRGWEFNIRKDEVITNSDMYAYPASHYSIPLESVKSIELVRGTGSLQYGAQFGGMLNYITKKGHPTKKIFIESINTAGSFGLFSTYNAIGGTIGKWKYYTYYAKRVRQGYRQNEKSDYDAQGFNLSFKPSDKVGIDLDYVRSNYVFRMAGPLTDAQFIENPRQATRQRNYFSPAIHIPSIKVNLEFSQSTKLQFISSALLGDRNSVLFDKLATVKDTINSTTMNYNPRQVDIDQFNSYTQELRLLHHHSLAGIKSTLAGGVQYMHNTLHRRQQGKGTTLSDYDLTLTDSIWGRDLKFKTKNIAVFIENSFSVSSHLSINVGTRLETGASKMNGKIVYYPDNELPTEIKHNYPLFGINASYKIGSTGEVYGGFSQTYRPMIFKDIIPSSIFEKIDPNIKDAKGYNAELGIRGKTNGFIWDVTGFILRYDNRFGTTANVDANGSFYTYRTNVGNSITKGLEIFLQSRWDISNTFNLTLFTSSSLMHGTYISGALKSGLENINISGNKIESVPSIISRNGAQFQWKKLGVTILHSYTSETFADPLNTVTPSLSGAVGIVPEYHLFDVNSSYKLSKFIELRASVNNLMNRSYFTKRPLFYPGPGIWPSDGRNASMTVVVNI